MSQKRYYPTALALYITYFVLGISSSVMGHYKQEFAALWSAVPGADGMYDISSVVAVIAAIGLGRLIAFPAAGPLSDKLGRRISALVGCALYAVFFTVITFTKSMYWGYALAVVSGMGNSFLDTSITPSCMEIFKEKGTIAAIFINASLLNKGLKPAKILIIYPSCALVTLAVVFLVQVPAVCLVGGFFIGFFAAGGVLQLVTSVANEMFPKNRGVITSIVMIASSVANYAVLNAASLITRVSGVNGPRYVLLFNMSVTLIGVILAVILNKRVDIDTAAQTQPVSAE